MLLHVIYLLTFLLFIQQQNLSLTLMNFDQPYPTSLYKNKQHSIQLDRNDQMKQISSSKKLNTQSSLISSKIIQQLSSFQDDQILSIQSSIPLLYTTNILQIMDSIQSAKQKMQYGQQQNFRLKQEARFIYCLWRMIDQEQIETRQLKQLIYMLHQKSIKQLKHELKEMYANQDAVSEFIQSWRALSPHYCQLSSKKKQKNVKDSKKQIEKIIVYDEDLQDSNYSNARELRELFINKQSNIKSRVKSYIQTQHPKPKENNFFTAQSGQFSSITKNHKDIQYFDRSKQKQVIDRLYKKDIYNNRFVQKKFDDQRKLKQQLQKCTFKPQIINDRLRSISNQKRSSSINGYSKAVKRMKFGQEKTRIQKEKRQYKPVGQNYQKLREKKINPPKFLQRKKNEQKVQFVIQFDLGKHKVKVKVHENDKQSDIALNLCKIYCLKQQYFQQICMIVRRERQIQSQKTQSQKN